MAMAKKQSEHIIIISSQLLAQLFIYILYNTTIVMNILNKA